MEGNHKLENTSSDGETLTFVAAEIMEDVCEGTPGDVKTYFSVCFDEFIEPLFDQVPESEAPHDGQLSTVRTEETERLNS